MIKIVDIEDVKQGRYCKPYVYYSTAISKYIPWLKEQISKSKEGCIYIRKNDLENGLGIKVVNFKSLLLALKFVLFEHGMVIDKVRLYGTRVLSIRMGTEDDELPNSLSKLGDKYYSSISENL